MSFNINWDIDKYREEHESDEHWLLRQKFMERWKSDYPEERLVCLARVFANMELLGCRYPPEVMQEVSGLAHEVAKEYRNTRKNKLQRTFVSASTAAEDRARGVKREAGVIVDATSQKSAKIEFVKQGQSKNNDEIVILDSDNESTEKTDSIKTEEKTSSRGVDTNEYLKELSHMRCLDIRSFNEKMFISPFGRMVLIVRPWTNKLSNIQASCQSCQIQLTNTYEGGFFSLYLNGMLVARASGDSKAEAKSVVETMAWNGGFLAYISIPQWGAGGPTRLRLRVWSAWLRLDSVVSKAKAKSVVETMAWNQAVLYTQRLRDEVISVVVKEQWIAHGDRISVSDVSDRKRAAAGEFGAPIQSSVAAKMMKLMGWKGGGLGADAQGIAEPIKPHLQMVNRAGLGSDSSDISLLRRAAQSLMQRYLASDTLDVDLVFSAEFSKEERAQLHKCAQRAGLASRSYGSDEDRFLVVRKKLDPFSLVRAVIDKGGNTPKYQVFIPVGLQTNGR